MSPTQADISSQMVTALGISIPSLDTSIGSVPRKIIDAVSQQIALAYLDNNLLAYTWDINTKSGSDLDNFLANFGFSRQAATRATGTVVLTRQTGFTNPTLVPAGTQVGTATSPTVVFATVVPVLVQPGATSVTIPIQAAVGGLAGNVEPGTITRLVSALSGIAAVNNTAATTGGADAESDAAFRQRFLSTVFRSLVGTEQMFLGVALEIPGVTLANVIGAGKYHRETIALTGGTGTSIVQNAKYIYNDTNVAFGTDLDQGLIFVPVVQYQFNPGNPDTNGNYHPVVLSEDAINVPDGVYDLQFTYVPQASRNSPLVGITNRIDVYVAGQNAVEALQTAIFNSTNLFVATQGVPLQASKFLRGDQITQPTVGNVFIPLAFGPVINPALSNQLTIQGQTYNENVDFWLVNDNSTMGGAYGSLSGIEFLTVANGQANKLQQLSITGSPTGGTFVLSFGSHATAAINWNATAAQVQTALANLINVGAGNVICGGGPLPATPITIGFTGTVTSGAVTVSTNSLTGGTSPAPHVVSIDPANGTAFPTDYTFNSLPRDVGQAIWQWKETTTDIMVHQAKLMYLNLYMGVILALGQTISAITPAIQQAIEAYLANIGFDSALQISDLISIVNAVPGVNACRMLNDQDGDPVHYAIEQVSPTSSTIINTFALIQQILQTTGAPTGGTFTLTYSGHTTSSLAWNATAAQVQNALVALTNLGANVTCTGGPLPTSPITITFSYGFSSNPALITTTSALTGGTAPQAVVTAVEPRRAVDVLTPDDTVPVLNALTLKQLALNTFGEM